uniref:glycosyltransferase family 2 protein n=1 Tax=Brachyspira catarrhinii TaxID=2528966 RepID=UPI003F4C9662
MIKVSIIIPVYNVQQYLSECLDSIINQTLKEIEIICVDDFSMDNSYKKLEDYKLKYENIKIIRHEKNMGLGPTRNTGIRKAIGEYIGFVDSDDYVSPDYFEKLYNTAKKYDSDITSTLNVYYNDNGNIYEKFMNINKFISEEERVDKNLYIEGESFVSIKDEKENTKEYMYVTAWNKIYKKSFLLDNNLFFMDIESGSEDLDFYIRILTNDPKTSYMHIPIYYHRIRSGSLMANRVLNDKHSLCTIKLLKNSVNYCKKYRYNYIKYVYYITFKNMLILLDELKFKDEIYKELYLFLNDIDPCNIEIDILGDMYYFYYLSIKSNDKYEGYLLNKILFNRNNILKNEINRLQKEIEYSKNWIRVFGIYNNDRYLFIYFLGIKLTFKLDKKIINYLSWWIPIRKWRDNFRNKFNFL